MSQRIPLSSTEPLREIVIDSYNFKMSFCCFWLPVFQKSVSICVACFVWLVFALIERKKYLFLKTIEFSSCALLQSKISDFQEEMFTRLIPQILTLRVCPQSFGQVLRFVLLSNTSSPNYHQRGPAGLLSEPPWVQQEGSRNARMCVKNGREDEESEGRVGCLS